VKILLTTDFNNGEVNMDVEEEEGGGELAAESSILKLLSVVRKVAAITVDDNAAQLDGQCVWRRVRMKAEVYSMRTYTKHLVLVVCCVSSNM
jgi:hypothetical protein